MPSYPLNTSSIIQPSLSQANLPAGWSDAARRAIAANSPAWFGIAAIDMGFLVVPTIGKRPLTAGGVHDATGDRMAFANMIYGVEEFGVGLIAPQGMALLDVDDPDATLGLDLADSYREQTPSGGFHAPLLLPTPMQSTTFLPGQAGELRCGPGAFTVVSPSPGYEPGRLDAPFHQLDPAADLWRWWIENTQGHTAAYTPERMALRPSEADFKKAKRVLGQLIAGQYGESVRLLIDGRWRECGYPSRSEADAALAFTATHFTNDPAVIAAVVWLVSEKVREHASPDQYVAITVAHAIAARDRKNATRIAAFLTRFGGACSLRPSCTSFSSPDALTTTVIGGTSSRGKGIASKLADTIGLFVRADWIDEYTRPDGWRRFPVEDAAAAFGVDRRTVSRAIVAAVNRDEIERMVLTSRHDGSPRSDTLVRKVGAA